MSIRKQLRDAIAGYLPPGWRVVEYERDIDPPSTTVVMLRQKQLRYEREIGRLIAVFKVSIISPHTENLQNAEDDLDNGVMDLLDAFLHAAPYTRVTGGEKTRFGRVGYPAWDIDLETPIERKL